MFIRDIFSRTLIRMLMYVNRPSATSMMTAAPPGIIYWEIPHPRRLRHQDCAGHLVITYWWLQTNDYDRYQNHRTVLLLKQYEIRRVLIAGDNNGGWQHTGGRGNGCLGLTLGLEHRADTLSRSKIGKLQGRHRQTDHAHRCIHPSLPPTWRTYKTWQRPFHAP